MNRVKGGATLATGLAMTQLDQAELWLRYFAVGGGCSFQALRAYLAGDIDWSAHEHDVAALALNEYFLEQGLDHPVRYSEDLLARSDDSERPTECSADGNRYGGAGPGRPAPQLP